MKFKIYLRKLCKANTFFGLHLMYSLKIKKRKLGTKIWDIIFITVMTALILCSFITNYRAKILGPAKSGQRLLTFLQGIRTIMNILVELSIFRTNKYQTRIALRAQHLETTLLILNVGTDYSRMWDNIRTDFFIIVLTVSSICLTLYKETFWYIIWESIGIYFSVGITYISVTSVRSPLLDISKTLYQITEILDKDLESLRKTYSVSKLDKLLLVSKAHTLIFESVEDISKSVSRFLMFMFCFTALQILIIVMTFQKEVVSKSFVAIAVFDFGMICYLIYSSADIKKKHSRLLMVLRKNSTSFEDTKLTVLRKSVICQLQQEDLQLMLFGFFKLSLKNLYEIFGLGLTLVLFILNLMEK